MNNFLHISNTYQIDKHKQLIDLNKNTINFALKFTCTSKDNDEYNMLVIDQDSLDSGKEIPYQVVKGTISGDVISDKNVYKNYFLILKADNKPTEVKVDIDFKELPLHEVEKNNNKSSSALPWKWIFIILILIIGGIIVYKLSYSKKDNRSISEPILERELRMSNPVYGPKRELGMSNPVYRPSPISKRSLYNKPIEPTYENNSPNATPIHSPVRHRPLNRFMERLRERKGKIE